MIEFVKNIIAIFVALIMAFFSLVGCEKNEEVLPITSSRELNMYISGSTIVNAEGDTVQGSYSLDDHGNIIDGDGQVIIAAKNIEYFSCVENIQLEQSPIKQKLKATRLSNGEVITRPASFHLKFSVGDNNIVNMNVRLESFDPGAVYFPYDMNASSLPEGTSIPRDNILPSIDLAANDDGVVDVIVVAAFDGTHEIVAKNYRGEEIGAIQVEVIAEFDDLSKDDGNQRNNHVDVSECEHDFRKETINPTVHTQGYTLFTCNLCGYSYREEYVPKLVCDHEWEKSRIVEPTYTTKGYTVYLCALCGKTEKRDELPVLVCQHNNMKVSKVSSTCSRDGYTLHECQDCRIYSFRDEIVPKTGHSLDDGKITKQPTCEEDGVLTYHCLHSGCKETRCEAIPARGHVWDSGVITKDPTCIEEGIRSCSCTICCKLKTEPLPKTDHVMMEEVVAPTTTSEGYTRHYCRVCGYEAPNTNIIPAVPHQHQTSWTIISEPTCGKAGIREARCSICGAYMLSEELPATGEHIFTENVSYPDCENDGYVTHTCSVCGYSYNDQVVPALGHDWIVRTEKRLAGRECHTICAECGMDLTENGIGGDAISDHTKAHVMAGGGGRTYETYIDIYDDVSVHTCSRCGRNQ